MENKPTEALKSKEDILDSKLFVQDGLVSRKTTLEAMEEYAQQFQTASHLPEGGGESGFQKREFYDFLQKDRLFFIDQVRAWFKMFDQGEISFSKFVELFNERVFAKYHNTPSPASKGMEDEWYCTEPNCVIPNRCYHQGKPTICGEESRLKKVCEYCEGKGYFINEDHPKWPEVQQKLDCEYCYNTGKIPESTSVNNDAVEASKHNEDANVYIDRAIAMLKEEYKGEWLIAGYNGIVSLLGYAKESHAASKHQPGDEGDAVEFSAWKDLYFTTSYPVNNKIYVLQDYNHLKMIKGVLYGEHYSIPELYTLFKQSKQQ